jgi:hypothetical protein
MFALRREDLAHTTTLDCPSGPDSFVAEACAEGLSVTGCDPMFALSPAELATQARKNIDDCFAAIDQQGSSLTFRNYAQFRQAKYDALTRFLEDFRSHRERYVFAKLPVLPFTDRSFDRVCAANFLFSYAHRSNGGLYDGHEFDLAFHLRSVEEITRVARSEIRISPMGSFDPPPRPHAFRDPVRARLEELGWQTELIPSTYDSGLAGFNDVLVARR